jgi:hypothetical protein
MTLEQAYEVAKQNMRQRKSNINNTSRAKVKPKAVSFRTFGHFVKGECYTHLQIAAWGQKSTFKLWRQPSPTFYRLGKYIAAGVEPISEKWPQWLHRVRANYISRNV